MKRVIYRRGKRSAKKKINKKKILALIFLLCIIAMLCFYAVRKNESNANSNIQTSSQEINEETRK